MYIYHIAKEDRFTDITKTPNYVDLKSIKRWLWVVLVSSFLRRAILKRVCRLEPQNKRESKVPACGEGHRGNPQELRSSVL